MGENAVSHEGTRTCVVINSQEKFQFLHTRLAMFPKQTACRLLKYLLLTLKQKNGVKKKPRIGLITHKQMLRTINNIFDVFTCNRKCQQFFKYLFADFFSLTFN